MFFVFSSVCCSKGWWECCGGSGLYGTPGADDIKLPADSAQVSSHPQGFPLLHQRHHHWQTHREGERVRLIFIFFNFYCLVINWTTVFIAVYHRNLFLLLLIIDSRKATKANQLIYLMHYALKTFFPLHSGIFMHLFAPVVYACVICPPVWFKMRVQGWFKALLGLNAT